MKKYIVVFLVTALSACSGGVRVLNTETGANVDLTKYKTFDFYKVRASGDTSGNINIFNARVELLKEAIGAELSKRGYTQKTDQPDMLVNIGIRVKEEIQTRQTDWKTDGAPRYIGQRNYTWKSEEVEVGRYKEGTVAIHLVDAAKNTMVWKGVIRGIVPEKQKNIQEAAQNGIKILFEKFPVPVNQ